MNLNQINSLLSRTTIGIPGAWFELAGSIAPVDPEAKWYIVRVATFGPNNDDPKAPHGYWPGRYWIIEPTHTEAQVKNTLLKAVLTYVEHEARERFKIDGRSLYEPAH